jgi:hypothetical protein
LAVESNCGNANCGQKRSAAEVNLWRLGQKWMQKWYTSETAIHTSQRYSIFKIK